MRVERSSATPPPSPPARLVRARTSSPTEPENAPSERWDGPCLDEREAHADEKEFIPPDLPGIKQGLTADYLRARGASIPTTLLADLRRPVEFALNCFPSLSNETDPGVRYAQNLAHHTRLLYQSYFPDQFLDLDLLIQVQSGDRNNAGYEWVQGRSRLTLQTSGPMGDEPQMQKTGGTLDPARLLRRGVSDLISFVHEYAHATYDALLGVPAGTDVQRANRAFSEGFAVLTELLALDHLLALPDHHLVAGDRIDLSQRRQDRVKWLQEVLEAPVPASQVAYAEGTELMASLHRRGGLAEVVGFIRAIVPNKANALSRAHPHYRKAVGCPRLMKELVG